MKTACRRVEVIPFNDARSHMTSHSCLLVSEFMRNIPSGARQMPEMREEWKKVRGKK
jgi:hypothetical protein